MKANIRSFPGPCSSVITGKSAGSSGSGSGGSSRWWSRSAAPAPVLQGHCTQSRLRRATGHMSPPRSVWRGATTASGHSHLQQHNIIKL